MRSNNHKANSIKPKAVIGSIARHHRHAFQISPNGLTRLLTMSNVFSDHTKTAPPVICDLFPGYRFPPHRNLAKPGKGWMLENMLHGAPLGFVVIGTLLNYEDRIFLPTLNDLYGFHKSNEKLFTNLQSISNVALIRGSSDNGAGSKV
jgi:hypothetical protein